jgi:nucleotide-binding universal stress UspA family protein
MNHHESGPVIVAYDGSPSSERALRDAAPLLAPRKVLVVVVWEPGLAFDLWVPPMPPAPIDVRTALAIDEAVYERAQRLAEQGAETARKLDLDTEGLAVADKISVACTLIRLAEERHAPAIVVGPHGHSGVREIVLGSTSRDLIRHAPCPVIVRRGPDKTNE